MVEPGHCARHEITLGRYMKPRRSPRHSPGLAHASARRGLCFGFQKPPWLSGCPRPLPPLCSHDTGLPKWFDEDERKFMRPQAQVGRRATPSPRRTFPAPTFAWWLAATAAPAGCCRMGASLLTA